MVTDLRPLRVQSADLVDLMRGFAERFRNESALALDLLMDSVDLQAPDRVCREIFQIYREALNNIKKHAKASHVVVKLTQDDSRLSSWWTTTAKDSVLPGVSRGMSSTACGWVRFPSRNERVRSGEY